MALSDKNLVSLVAAEHIGPNETGDNIDAKRAAGYVWNPDTSQWERMTQPSFSGDLTVDSAPTFKEDPSDTMETPKYGHVSTFGDVQVDVLSLPNGVALETKQDDEITQLTALNAKDFATQTTLALIKAKTDNLDVALSTRAVTGLTDTQLRATPVPISGSVTSTKLDTVVTGTITTQNLVPAGVATASSAVQSGNLNGASTIIVQTTGTYSVVLFLQITVDGTTWVTLNSGDVFTNLNNNTNSTGIPTGQNSIFQAEVAGAVKVRVTALAAVTGTATVTINISEASNAVRIQGSLPAGSAVLGAITNIIPGTGNTNLGAAVDAAAGATKTGVLGLAVRDDALTTLTPVDNDYTEHRVDSTGALWSHITTIDASALPTGASTSALQTSGNASLTSIDTKLTSPLTVGKKMGTSTPATNVSTSTTVATLLALNTSRVKATIYNDSTTGMLLIKEGAAASATSFHYALSPATATSPGGQAIIDDYSGIITGILTTGTGTARVGETS